MSEENYSPEERTLLSNYVTDLDKNIYVLFNLPPEVIAVLFAYVSRSPNSFRKNLLKLIKQKDLELVENSVGIDFTHANEKAKKFHEKWVVGYGHGSVAEHAFASVAIEDVSILATKVIEDNRLASYTEKSTRYQIFDKTRYYKPKKIMDSEFRELYTTTMDFLFDEYNDIVLKLIDFVKEIYPQEKVQSDRFYESISKARACDIARYILPAGTLTNLGMTANARAYEHAITKMLSNSLEEVQIIGSEIKQEIKKIIPTLVKYADKNEYMSETETNLSGVGPVDPDSKSYTRLVEYDTDAVDKFLASILYRFGDCSYSSAKKHATELSPSGKKEVIDRYLKKMGRHDYPLRELEHIYYTFDVLVDYGAFRDIQRHRMATQTNPDFTVTNGYSVPPELIQAGLEERYKQCMSRSKDAYEKIAKKFPKEAQYVIPLAYRKRVLFTWNLRTLYHFIKLRSSREGHISYRKVAWDCYDEVLRVHPEFKNYLKVDKSMGPSR